MTQIQLPACDEDAAAHYTVYSGEDPGDPGEVVQDVYTCALHAIKAHNQIGLRLFTGYAVEPGTATCGASQADADGAAATIDATTAAADAVQREMTYEQIRSEAQRTLGSVMDLLLTHPNDGGSYDRRRSFQEVRELIDQARMALDEMAGL